MKTRDLVLIGLLIGIGTLSAHVLAIPVAGARVFPVQHAINVIAGVLLGPGAGVTIAFTVGLLRNVLGTGTLLAFPGGMVGALLAGYAYRLAKKPWAAALGEVFGTGVLGAMLAYPFARMVLGHSVMALAYVVPFSLSSVTGAVIGLLLLVTLRSAGVSRQPM
ncbi:MAG: energy coupling factor transporter S component ThiW [Ignavibacteriales bacterium]